MPLPMTTRDSRALLITVLPQTLERLRRARAHPAAPRQIRLAASAAGSGPLTRRPEPAADAARLAQPFSTALRGQAVEVEHRLMARLHLNRARQVHRLTALHPAGADRVRIRPARLQRRRLEL